MIDLNGKHRTRDGREVRLYAVDGEDGYPVHGAIKTDRGWSAASWCKNGQVNDKIPHPIGADLCRVDEE